VKEMTAFGFGPRATHNPIRSGFTALGSRGSPASFRAPVL
jgi:hypothetical protein